MVWHLSASGSAMDSSAEAELYERLAELLHDEDYGLASSHFSGEHNNGPLPKPKPKATGKK